MRTARWFAGIWVLACATIVGCGDDTSTTTTAASTGAGPGAGGSTSTATGSGGSAPTGSGGAGGGGGAASTDQEACERACSRLVDCGANQELGVCVSGCVDPAAAELAACVKESEDECNAVARCFWEASCGADGVPSGESTCEDGEQCAAQCVGKTELGSSCQCSCAAEVAPGLAMVFYLFSECAKSHCADKCGVTGNALLCATCLGQNCDQEKTACK